VSLVEWFLTFRRNVRSSSSRLKVLEECPTMGDLGDNIAMVLLFSVFLPDAAYHLPKNAASWPRRHEFTCFSKLISRALYSSHCDKKCRRLLRN
jgi:hypothetical protein